MPLADVAWAVDDLRGRSSRLRLFRDYYEGEHASVVPDTRTLSPLMKNLLQNLTDNLCDDVVDEPVDRLEVLNWSATSTDVEVAAGRLWDEVRGPAWMREVFRCSFREGDGYVIVDRTPRGLVRPYVQRPERMAVRYDERDPGVIKVAAKAWQVGRAWRLNLYYGPVWTGDGSGELPDGIPLETPWVERYTTRGSASDGSMPSAKSFQPVEDSDGAGQAIEALEGDRIPVFHYPAEEWGRYGRSALADVIGLQDVLNKSVADLVVAGEFTALPQRWATGIQAEIDPVTGQEKPLFRSGVERLLRTGSKDASFGQFASSDLSQFLSVQSTYRMEIARKGKLPLHSVSLDATGNAPSGLSLLVAEGRTVKRVRTAQDEGGLVLREQMAYMLTLNGLRTAADDLRLDWASPQTRDEQALLEALTIKVENLGLPKRQALIEDGYDPDDVDTWLDDAAAAQDAAFGGRQSPAGATTLLPGPAGLVGLPAVPQGPAGAAAVTA